MMKIRLVSWHWWDAHRPSLSRIGETQAVASLRLPFGSMRVVMQEQLANGLSSALSDQASVFHQESSSSGLAGQEALSEPVNDDSQSLF